MKSGQNTPRVTRTITTTPHRTSQDEPPIEEREEEKLTKNKHNPP